MLLLAGGDMRRALNVLQSAHLAGNGTTLTTDSFYATTGTPHPNDIRALWEVLRAGDFDKGVQATQQLSKDKEIAVNDLVNALLPLVENKEEMYAEAKYFYVQLAEIEHRLSVGASKLIKSTALVATFNMAHAIGLNAAASS